MIGGFFPRLGAVALAAVITGALVTVQIPAGITAGLERDLLILAGTLLLAAHGPGRFGLHAAFANQASKMSGEGASQNLKGEVIG